MQIRKETHVFSKVGEDDLKMDVYYPFQQRADKACVVILHGGGFAEGSRDDEWSVETAEALTKKGFVVISMDYQLGMLKKDIVKANASVLRVHYLLQYCIDLALGDLVKAIRYVCDYSKELNVDSDRMILAGSSAGAIVALQFDYYRINHPQKLPSGLLPKWWQPAAVVAYSGAIMAKRGFEYEYEPSPTLFFHGLMDKIVKPGKQACSLRERFFGSLELYERISGWRDAICWIFKVDNVGHEVAMLLPETVEIFCSFVEHALSRKPSRMEVVMRDARVVPTEWTTKTIFDLLKENSQKLGLSE